jgi:nicotinate-nucleotide adenylyltransferase
MKKIGLLGGTFDPIHYGHLIISEYLRDLLKLAEIWFIPTKIHPLKSNDNITCDEYRVEMLELAIENNQYFKCCKIEIERGDISYTIDTIDQLYKDFKQIEPVFYLFIGMDNVNELDRWKEPMHIIRRTQVIAFGRPGFKTNKSSEKFLPYLKFIEVPLLEISSTDIRNRVREGKSVRYLVPDPVRTIIEQKGLYKQP